MLALQNKVNTNLNIELEPPFQNAITYDDNFYYDVDYWFVSYKLDGVRCRYSNKNYMPISKRFKILHNAHRFTPIIARILDEFELEIIDGEIYNHNLSFNEIQGILNTKKPKMEDLKKLEYHIFALYSNNIKNTNEMVNELNKIKNWLNEYNIEYIKVVDYWIIENDNNVIINERKKAENKGYEGIILRNPYQSYNFERTESVLKVKAKYTADLIIENILKGNKSFNNMCGSLVCSGYVEDRKKNEKYFVRCKVGSGIDYDLRKEIWNNKEKYIGKTVEVEYKGMTINKTKNIHSLRFPVFLRFKNI